MGRARFMFFVFISLTLVVALNIQQALAIDGQIQDAILKGNWKNVIEFFENDGSKANDPVARLIMGHACLATNRNNPSMLLFLSVKEERDLKLWSQWAESLLRRYPQNPVALYLSADAKARQSEFKAAIEQLSQAVKIKEDFAMAYNSRGVLHVLNNELDSALLDFYAATKVAPDFADAHANLGSYWVITEASEGALEAFDKALSWNSEFALAYNGRGCAYFGKGEFEKASQDFSMASHISPILAISEINQGFASAYASKLVTLAGLEKKPGVTLESTNRQYVSLLKEQNQQLSNLLPPQKDQDFWGKIDAFPTLSQDQITSIVNDYGLQKVQLGGFVKMQELKGQIVVSQQTVSSPDLKIDISSRTSYLAFSSLGLDKSIDGWTSFYIRPPNSVNVQNVIANISTPTSYGQGPIHAAQLQIVNNKLNHLDETYITAQNISASIGIFNKAVGFLEDITQTQLPYNRYTKIPLTFLPAIIKDINEKNYSPLTTHTLEEVGKFGLKILPSVVDRLKEAGQLPQSFRIPPTMFGIDEFVAGGASQLGSGKLGIEEITHYLDGISKMTAAVAGALVGGPKVAKIAESAAGLAQDVFRGLTMPLFQEMAYHPVRQNMIKDWQSLQGRRISDGLTVLRFSEMFTPSLLKEVRFDSKIVSELDSFADWTNSTKGGTQLSIPFPSNVMPRQTSSQIPGYYTATDRPLTELGALASMVDKGIKGTQGSERNALIVSQDSFRANLLQSELSKYGFQSKIVSPGSDLQAIARQYGADVILGIRGTTQIKMPQMGAISVEGPSKKLYDVDISKKFPPPFPPDKGGGGAGIPRIDQPTIPKDWNWGKPFAPISPKALPGGVSTEELARSFVDKGNWPVMTSFSLFYSTTPIAEEQTKYGK